VGVVTLNHATVVEDVLRPTQVEVNLTRLADNFRALQAAARGARVMGVLKANAYGHGMLRVAEQIVTAGADILGVAFLEEGILLRRHGIDVPILVLGGIIGNQVPLFLEHDLTLTASSIDKLSQIEAAAAAASVRARVHLKIDTGMERIGVHYYSAEKLLEASLRCRHTTIEGIYSHFANADAEDLSHARLQLERFLEVVSFYERRSLPMPVRHMANSAALARLPQSCLDLVRPGILLYGISPSPFVTGIVPVRPALAWKTRVVYFKVVRGGDPVGYGSTWTPDHPVRLVTVPVGYGDGYSRSLSNRAFVLIRGRRYPIVGSVCMDQAMVNLEQGKAYNGDEVVLVGEDGSESITAEDLAAWAGTIPYEILTGINTRVPRVYVRDDSSGATSRS
jgi:alanine racemase